MDDDEWVEWLQDAFQTYDEGCRNCGCLTCISEKDEMLCCNHCCDGNGSWLDISTYEEHSDGD